MLFLFSSYVCNASVSTPADVAAVAVAQMLMPFQVYLDAVTLTNITATAAAAAAAAVAAASAASAAAAAAVNLIRISAALAWLAVTAIDAAIQSRHPVGNTCLSKRIRHGLQWRVAYSPSEKNIHMMSLIKLPK